MDCSYSLEELDAIVLQRILPLMACSSIFTFSGQLGAGKTTCIKKILLQCGVTDIVTSPTFAYMNTYKGYDEKIFNHFDLYRINSLEEFISFGFDEYLYNEKNYNFIEWPDVISPLLKNLGASNRIIDIKFDYGEDILARYININ